MLLMVLHVIRPNPLREISTTMKKTVLSLATALLAPLVQGQVLINEVDADTPGSDMAEFVELYDGGVGNTDLTGMVLVFFNGSNSDRAYRAIDLDGFSTNGSGFFVAGNSGVANTDLVFPTNGIQNGADAVALYMGDASDFPSTAVATSVNLVDAVVYDTNDGDDAGLIAALTPGQPQINEGGGAGSSLESIQRKPDGGVALNTSSYIPGPPTPGASNGLPAEPVTISFAPGGIEESSFGMITATISRTGSTGALDVSLSLDDDSEAVLSDESVTIPDTQTSTTVDIFPIDDLYPDGDQIVTLTALPTGGVEESSTFTVSDDPGDTFSLVVNEVNSIPQSDLNGDSVVNSDDEFVEIINVSASPIDLTGYTLEDEFNLIHNFRDGTVLGPGCALLVVGKDFSWGSSANFGTAEVQIASETFSGLRLTDSGDQVKIFNDLGDEVYLVDVPDLTGTPSDGSYVLSTDADATSGYVRHLTLNASETSSPGTTSVAGAPFCNLTSTLSVLAVPPSVAENAGAGAVLVTVSVLPPFPTADLTVFVYSGDESEIAVPGSEPIALGTIAAGAGLTTVPIPLDVIDDDVLDGTQTVTLTAGASGYLNGTTTIDVTDEGDVATFTGLVINEVDADTPLSGDAGEFVELYETAGTGGSLNGLVLVMFNGNGDVVYDAVDLSGWSISANGFFVIGDNGSIDTNDGIQNGADAVAIFVGSVGDFPDGTPVATAVANNVLVDALVYGTSDSDDAGLLAALTPGQPQANEGSSNNTNSSARVPDGSGSFSQQDPTPGATNAAPSINSIVINSVGYSGSTLTIDYTTDPASSQVDIYRLLSGAASWTEVGGGDDTDGSFDDSGAGVGALYQIVPEGGDAPANP